jgi:hypothetical protein
VKRVLAVLLATLASMAAASAQMSTSPNMEPPPSAAFGPDPILQITTTFQARIEGLADARDVPTRAAQDTARRSLYNMAANECTVLAEFWRAECRLSSFDVYVAVDDVDGPGVQPHVPSMFGRAVYGLRLTSLPGR